VNAALPAPESTSRLKWSKFPIVFDANDHPKSTKAVGVVPLLCTPTISNVAITKTLINGGACLNMFPVETFETLQVPYERLMPTRPFSGITDGSTIPLG
jgi:hypothetical protein